MKLYGLFFWFLFNENQVEEDMKILFQTFLKNLSINYLRNCETRELFLLLKKIFMVFEADKETMLIFESSYDLGLIKNQDFLQLIVSQLLKKNKQNNTEMKKVLNNFNENNVIVSDSIIRSLVCILISLLIIFLIFYKDNLR